MLDKMFRPFKWLSSRKTKGKLNSVFVGPLHDRRSTFAPGSRGLLSMHLTADKSVEQQIRAALFNNAAIEVVDDPVGIYLEGVPFEDMIYIGDEATAQGLRLSLNRYFKRLTYRDLDFKIATPRTSTLDLGESLLFGEYIKNQDSVFGGAFYAEIAGNEAGPYSPENGVQRWNAAQTCAVFQLCMGDRLPGVPWIDPKLVDTTKIEALLNTPQPLDLACTIDVGSDVPEIALRRLDVPKKPNGQVTPLLHNITTKATVKADEENEIYTAEFSNLDLKLTLVPDSSFSRFVRQPRSGVDHLEIIGIAMPNPAAKNKIEAVSVSLGKGGFLRAYGLMKEHYRITCIGKSERHILFAESSSYEISKKGKIPKTGHRIQLGSKAEVAFDKSLGLSYLSAGEGNSFGWIPLRLGDSRPTGSNYVSESPIQYHRDEWVSPTSKKFDMSSIYLDWLNQAVEIIRRNDNGKLERTGLANWCEENLTEWAGDLSFNNGSISVSNSSFEREAVAEGVPFALGPLVVKYRRRTEPET